MPDDEWWLRIAHAFDVHVRDERYVLSRYQELASSTTDPGTRFLLELIVEDERRHHALFEQLRASISGATPEDGPAVPAPPNPEPEHISELLAQTTRFLEIEHGDASGLRLLARDLKPRAHETLWRLLVELMLLDTEKHIRILTYLKQRLDELS